MVDSNLSLDLESDQNHHPNLESEFESRTTNLFGDPNRLSLYRYLICIPDKVEQTKTITKQL